MLVAWGALTVGLVGVVTFVAFSRGPKTPASTAPVSSSATSEPTLEAAPAIIEQEPAPAPSATAATSAEPPAEEFSESLKQRHLGYLTVHSSAPHATVYVNLKARGKIDEKLTVPCGNRFVSIGVQTHTGEPSWLAPGKSFVIPCGGPLEITMDPHALRSP
jgi:hypothetical protein